jgi:hypothetical protein
MTESNRLAFHERLRWLRAERQDLLLQLDNRVATEDSTPVQDLPLDWGIAGDLQHDIDLLKQLLRMEQ